MKCLKMWYWNVFWRNNWNESLERVEADNFVIIQKLKISRKWAQMTCLIPVSWKLETRYQIGVISALSWLKRGFYFTVIPVKLQRFGSRSWTQSCCGRLVFLSNDENTTTDRFTKTPQSSDQSVEIQ